MSRYAIGHILIKSKDLKHDVSVYEKWGFTVTYRTDPQRSHNALIYFRDGSFLELFDPKPAYMPDRLITMLLKLFRHAKSAKIKRFMHYLSCGGGITDYAIDSVPSEEAELSLQLSKQAGARISSITKLSKTLPDGRKQRWWIAIPEEPALPFYMSAYDPPVICHNNELTHHNGVQGIDCLVIDVPDVEEAVLQYKPLFPQISESHDPQQYELVFEKRHRIILRQADKFRLAEIHLYTSQSRPGNELVLTNDKQGTKLEHSRR
ncbi:VOC family protein [Paenibacillus sp. MMS20-IR301]|uniref:VOC family protein n=1 Tax=Paenibacillus sp. MMS20-IR301 TaxID=2895946 RepID=UPI0028E5E2EB|nr:VOC family protein [Paenibacillus sp. MMS20-IR301]WNS43110.1 VOC family protein [Paenibacillus sp. MMS20-IR301]